MSTGLAPVFPVDSSHPETPGFQGALMRATEEFGKDVNAKAAVKPGSREDSLSDAGVFARAREAYSQAKQYYDGNLQTAWERSYKAFRNEHFRGSKYNSPEFRGRSKLFRPKTRSAVRKQMTNAANALFASADAISISAEDESNAEQRMSAALKQEIISYRLSRKSNRNGVRWFMVAMGARQTSTLSGVCISKQYWRYREDDEGNKLEDRPTIELYPPENVLLDPNADWTNPSQSAAYIILRNPMTAEDALGMIEATSGAGGILWMEDIDLAVLQSGGVADTGESNSATRQARTGGSDPKQDAHGVFKQIWLHEVFMRIHGEEYVFWTLGNQRLLSRPQKLRKAYPHKKGERPIVIGYGALEAFRTFPMSPAESWQPLQLEANDTANLRLDHMKQLVSRPTFVKRGASVDIQQVQRRGPGSIVLVNNAEDVQPEQIPDVPQSAYVESQYLNADFDDLSGVFNSGSVQTNRSLNETVGGMKLLAGDANAVGEFDLAVWVETWAEPVLWDLVQLEEFYENDEKVLALCGRKAQLLELYGRNEITDKLLEQETTLVLNIGVGSTSTPQEKVNRFMTAAQGVGQILAPFWEKGLAKPPMPKQKEILDTVFGGAGFHDAADRFFQPMDDDKDAQELQQRQQQGPPPDPEKEAKAQAIQQKAAADAELSKLKMSIAREQGQLDMALKQLDYAMKVQDAQLEQQLRQQEAQLRASIASSEHQARQQELALNSQITARDADMKAQFGAEKHQTALEAARAKMQMQGQRPAPGGKPGSKPAPKPAGAAPSAMPAMQPPQVPPLGGQQPQGDVMQTIAQLLAQTAQTLAALKEDQDAPAEMIRDPVTSQAVAVRKGNSVKPVIRNDRGEAVGLGPAQQGA
jgi:hypothetical protein